MPKKTAASASNTDSNHVLLFNQQDDPRANETLRAALDRTPTGPFLGLVVKVREDASGEQVVNWMFTDAEHIKFLALSAQNEKKTNPSGVK